MNPSDRQEEPKHADVGNGGAVVADCPQCGFPMLAIRGSKQAICSNCGFKDSCCY